LRDDSSLRAGLQSRLKPLMQSALMLKTHLCNNVKVVMPGSGDHQAGHQVTRCQPRGLNILLRWVVHRLPSLCLLIAVSD
jgi:hypothetical protein